MLDILNRFRLLAKRVKLRTRVVRDEALDAALNEVGVRELSLLLVHSSLSSCGYIKKGALKLLQQFESRCETLCLPTHTYCYTLPDGSTPVFDPQKTGSLVGAVSDCFWQAGGVFRSLHPSHSIAAKGEGSEAICTGHELAETPCGERTPYELLIQNSASVLMFGCTLNTYTLFHTTEALMTCDYLYYPEPVVMRFIGPQGLTARQMKRQDMRVPRRFAEMEDELLKIGLLRRVSLGKGKLLFIPNAKDVHSYLEGRISESPRYLLANL